MNTQHRQLNRQDYKTLSLSALGGALEFYDFIVYAFFASMISELFFPPHMPDWLKLLQTFGIFAAGYLSRPFGGIIMAHFGDLVGRKRMFALSILLMAIPTFAIGLLPTYASIGVFAPILLLLMRVMQGAAIGGEVPGAWVFVSEHVPANRMGLACGILTSGLTLGILLGSLVYMLLNSVMTQDTLREYGWRIPFLLGGVFGFMTMYLRRWLKETPIFVEMQERKKLAQDLPLKSVLMKHRESVIISMLLTWVLSAGILVVIIMAPTYLTNTLELPLMDVSIANSIAVVALAIGCVCYGALIEKIGVYRTFVFGGLFACVSVFIFYYTANHSPEMIFWSYPLAGFSVGFIGSFAYVMVRAFPAVVRFTGVSLSFNMAYAITAAFTTPLVLTLTQFVSVMSPAYYVIVLFSMGMGLGVYLRRQRQANDAEIVTETLVMQSVK